MLGEMTLNDLMNNEAELLERTRARDDEAFRLLVDRHKGLLVNYLTRLTGCRDRAEDYAQEAFIRFYQQIHRYREEGALSAYLLRIATNLVRSDERRKKRWKVLEPLFMITGFKTSHGSANAHGAITSPQGEALAHEEQRQVVQALESLDLLYRAPIVLREIEGMSYRDIAAALEISVGTVKSRLNRGRQLLKQELAPYWNGGECTHG